MVVDGGYSGSSFDAALFFMRQCGLRLHDRIVVDAKRLGAITPKRYFQNWDYCFVLSNGTPKAFNPICDTPNKHAGVKYQRNAMVRTSNYKARRQNEGGRITPCHSKRGAIWAYSTGGVSNNPARHPAPMPIKLAQDLIRSYSNPGDLVLDPFSGSATTAYAAQQLGRQVIGIEVHKPYITAAIEARFVCAQPALQAHD